MEGALDELLSSESSFYLIGKKFISAKELAEWSEQYMTLKAKLSFQLTSVNFPRVISKISHS